MFYASDWLPRLPPYLTLSCSSEILIQLFLNVLKTNFKTQIYKPQIHADFSGLNILIFAKLHISREYFSLFCERASHHEEFINLRKKNRTKKNPTKITPNAPPL